MVEVTPRLIAEHMMSREGAAPAWGLVLEEARAGYARVSMTLRPDMLNGFGGAHGGMIFALADAAFAYACNSHNVATVAAQASIVFLASPKAGDTLVAEARAASPARPPGTRPRPSRASCSGCATCRPRSTRGSAASRRTAST